MVVWEPLLPPPLKFWGGVQVSKTRPPPKTLEGGPKIRKFDLNEKIIFLGNLFFNHQIRADYFKMYTLIYRLVLRLIFHFLWQSQTTQNNYKKFVSQKQGKITTENIAYFPYQKSESQKQRKFTTKNLVCFSYQKINVSGAPPFQIRAENI